MASSTLTRWLLRALADNWPGGLPSDLQLIDRDDPSILSIDTSTSPTTLTRDRRSMEFDLAVANTLGVSTTAWDQSPAGLGGDEYRAEPVLTVRIEAAHVDSPGHVDHAEDFIDNYALPATKVVQQIDNGTLQDAPVADFHVADPTEPTPQMVDYKDYYRWDFDVEPRGYRTV